MIGIKGKIRTFAGSAVSERFPILYKIKGRTKIYAAQVTDTMSRKPNFGVTQLKYFSILGARNITAKAAKNESSKDTSNTKTKGLNKIITIPARSNARATS